MAKLKLAPIINVRAGNGPAVMCTDKQTRARWDQTTGSLTITIAEGQASITAYWDHAHNGWNQIDATITARANSVTAARVNRLLKGADASMVSTYHRTQSLVVRSPGRAVDLPATIGLERKWSIGLAGDGKWSRWAETVRGITTNVAPSIPVTPAPHRAAPTPAPTTIDGITVTQEQTAQGTVTVASGQPSMSSNELDAALAEMERVANEHKAARAAAATPVTPERTDSIDTDNTIVASTRKSGKRTVNFRKPKPAPVPEPEPAPTTTVKVQRIEGDAIAFTPQRSTTQKVVTSKDNAEAIEAAWRQHIGGDQAVMCMVGPSGTGKTSLIFDLAADKGVPVFIYDAAAAGSFQDWVGSTILKGGDNGVTTEFRLSDFLDFVRIDGPYGGMHRIAGLDEWNRAETGGALNANMPMLAQGHINIPEYGTVYIDPKVMFVGTMNRGSAYNATLALDAALADRVQWWVMLDHLTETQEIDLLTQRTGIDAAKAKRLVTTAKQVRDMANRAEITTSVSVRSTLDASRAVVNGLTPLNAAIYCWANAYMDEGGDEGDRGRVIKTIRASLEQSNDEVPF